MASPSNLKATSFLFLVTLIQFQSFGQYFLPLVQPWKGRSQELIVGKNDPWITPAEKAEFKTTPSYAETLLFLKLLSQKSSQIQLRELGKTAIGQPLFAVLVSKEGKGNPIDFSKTGRPTLMVQAGIHSGEIDGKDAGLMLLRDIALGKKPGLLDKVNLIFIPILNVDGHEKPSPFNRPNQRGPENAGLRTNAHNLNLNRDYMKQETPEIREVCSFIHSFRPDLYMDIHVTDGADYQYDITYGYTGQHGHSPAIARWLDSTFSPTINRQLKAWGHIPGAFLNPTNDRDFSQGNTEITYGPNFSHAYGDLIHLPTVLVENHSLKPYRQRVLGTYVLIESVLNLLAADHAALRKAVKKDVEKRDSIVPLAWKVPEKAKPDSMEHLGIQSRLKKSPVTGAEYVEWLGKPERKMIPLFKMNEPTVRIKRPKGYWIPAIYREILLVLTQRHNIKVEMLDTPKDAQVAFFKMTSPVFATKPFEGKIQVKAKAEIQNRDFRMDKGSFFVSTDQPLGDLVVALLEPDSPESLFQWGFFNSIFQRTEYIEPYFLELIAEKMLADSPDLRQQFEQKKRENPAFGDNPQAILEWFFAQSPYNDQRAGWYPIGRVE